MDAMPTKDDVKHLTVVLPIQIKMLKSYKEYEEGHVYQVPAKIGEVILNKIYGYRVD